MQWTLKWFQTRLTLTVTWSANMRCCKERKYFHFSFCKIIYNCRALSLQIEYTRTNKYKHKLNGWGEGDDGRCWCYFISYRDDLVLHRFGPMMSDVIERQHDPLSHAIENENERVHWTLRSSQYDLRNPEIRDKLYIPLPTSQKLIYEITVCAVNCKFAIAIISFRFNWQLSRTKQSLNNCFPLWHCAIVHCVQVDSACTPANA